MEENKILLERMELALKYLELENNKTENDLKEIDLLKESIKNLEGQPPTILTLTDEEIYDFIKSLPDKNFYCDGCFCGDFTYSFSPELHLNVYRSCHKSSGCPASQSWELGPIGFYKELTKEEEGFYGEIHNELNIILNEEQEKLIRIHLDRKSEEERGSAKYYYDDERNEEYQGIFELIKLENEIKVTIAKDMSIKEAENLLEIIKRNNKKDTFLIQEIL